jgi:predicted DsbA family dithiol-disulfide isomerase
VSYVQRLAGKYQTSPAQAQAMIDRMTKVAAADGLELRFDRVQAGNTFDAHRLLQLAHERGVQNTLQERLFRAYLTEGEPIGEPAVLARLAVEAGLDPDEVDAVLSSDEYVREVRADEREARELGINGVPFFVLAGRLGVSGAQTPEILEAAIARAWDEQPKAAPVVIAQGAVCDREGCD